ncbi:MAG: hypothetical protein AAF438_08150, partial [Pseudomonadota bacterium]
MGTSRLVDLYLNNQRPTDAVPLVAMLEEADPNSPDVLILQARLAHQRTQPDVAFEYMKRAKGFKREAWSTEDQALLDQYGRLADE